MTQPGGSDLRSMGLDTYVDTYTEPLESAGLIDLRINVGGFEARALFTVSEARGLLDQLQQAMDEVEEAAKP
jgi:hypothetical protein